MKKILYGVLLITVFGVFSLMPVHAAEPNFDIDNNGSLNNWEELVKTIYNSEGIKPFLVEGKTKEQYCNEYSEKNTFEYETGSIEITVTECNEFKLNFEFNEKQLVITENIDFKYFQKDIYESGEYEYDGHEKYTNISKITYENGVVTIVDDSYDGSGLNACYDGGGIGEFVMAGLPSVILSNYVLEYADSSMAELYVQLGNVQNKTEKPEKDMWVKLLSLENNGVEVERWFATKCMSMIDDKEKYDPEFYHIRTIKVDIENSINYDEKIEVKKEFLDLGNGKFDLDKNKVLSFRIDHLVELFNKVYVDGKEVDEKNYKVTSKVTSGSTVVTFTEDYTKTLKNGKHTIKVTFTDDSIAETNFEILRTDTVKNPNTSITTGVGLGLIIGLGLCGLAYTKIRKFSKFPQA